VKKCTCPFTLSHKKVWKTLETFKRLCNSVEKI
jgi:hypothetical protein